MRIALTAAAALLILPLSLPVMALDVSVAAGTTDDSGQLLRLGVQQDFGQRWCAGRLGGYWDAGYTYWREDRGGSNHSLALTPVFVWEFSQGGLRPYVEAGIGVALFSDTRLDDQHLGSAFQFEDRLGLGLRFGRHDIGLRATHYSNAGLSQPNDGAESWTLYYRTAL